jgi:hypothetical protein
MIPVKYDHAGRVLSTLDLTADPSVPRSRQGRVPHFPISGIRSWHFCQRDPSGSSVIVGGRKKANLQQRSSKSFALCRSFLVQSADHERLLN